MAHWGRRRRRHFFSLDRIEHRYAARSIALRTQYAPIKWRGRPSSDTQADAIIDHPLRGSTRINLGDANMRKLLANRRRLYASVKQVTLRWHERRCANRKTSGARAAKYLSGRSRAMAITKCQPENCTKIKVGNI